MSDTGMGERRPKTETMIPETGLYKRLSLPIGSGPFHLGAVPVMTGPFSRAALLRVRYPP
jgi:hypothetical protein